MGKRDFLSLSDVSATDLTTILDRAQQVAVLWEQKRMEQCLEGKQIALVVNDTGWRNTTAFDLGIQAMGGLCIHAPLRWDVREELTDLAAYLDNWFDGVVTRAPDLALMRRLAEASRGPVINARTQQNHPCETLGDLAFHLHRHGRIAGIKVGVVSPHSNILGSWIEAATTLPIEVVQVYPEKWHAHDAASNISRFQVSSDMRELIDVDILITDCWPSDGETKELLDYQITAAFLDKLSPQCDFVPCPPVSRGKEVSTDAMNHPACHVIAAKAFLLHAQNAVLEWAFTSGS